MRKSNADAARRAGAGAIGTDRPDLVCAAMLAVAAMALSLWGFARIGSSVYRPELLNLWFEGDLPVVASRMTGRYDQSRTAVHPIFGLLLYIPARSLVTLGLDRLDAARFMVILAAGATAGLFFL